MPYDQNILNIIQRQKAYIGLETNPKVQKMWKEYKKKTKGLERLSKSQFYDVYLKYNKPQAFSRFAEPHLEIE